ncbi:MAG: hypothetical protein DMG21_09960 [Acidobacteria bacterium]|nr:MAG: hypothetical protein DMG21_09960 [Acidobacteriota bacterium]
MRTIRIFAASLALGLAAAIAVFAQGNYKIGTAGSTPSDLPASMAGALNPQGTSLLDASGGTVANIWWAKAISGTAGGSPDAAYPDLAIGTFVGVLQLPKGGSDFRGQKIKPGAYTLRYAHIPQDGNHMGVNPYPDFVLLVPAASDTDPGKTFALTDLVKVSKLATGTNHPAIMSLVPAAQSATFPSLVQDDQGHWVLQVQVSESSGGSVKQLPLALIVVGQTSAT